ncbi:STAS domain-containing protein [Streptomonospora litoralis]|uniref:Anti-sigma factor antagonist n=1 Tax=Streptomonospora litoralis TaxID=2498135 RepID=A0A4P6Q5Z4_9ACTN|nr:STAS domain-containing protein [Streptomonospora litoralis]QBI54197.1 Anti-sigma-B factor antagonist [Streptomonospora litoralis]
MPGETGANGPQPDDGEAVVVAVRGEIDIATADDMRDRLLAAAGEPGCAVLIADFTGVDFFDASGVRALMAARRRLGARGVRLVLGGPSAAVLRTLEALDLAAEFPVLPVAQVPFIPRPALRR